MTEEGLCHIMEFSEEDGDPKDQEFIVSGHYDFDGEYLSSKEDHQLRDWLTERLSKCSYSMDD